MKGLLHPGLPKAIPASARWLAYAEPAVEALRRDLSGLDEESRLDRLGQLNVVEQMTHLHGHPAVEERFRTGHLGIHGWFYEIHTGQIDAYDPGSGRFLPWPE
jgi:carbonic anhydrase